MIDLGINGIGKTYFSDPVFTNVSLEVKQGERIGLLGDNGTGKTTIFRMINGEEKQDFGDIFIRNGIGVGYLKQKPLVREQMNVEEVLYEAFESFIKIRKEMDALSTQMTKEPENISLVEVFGQKQIAFESLGGYDIEEKMSKIVQGMKLEGLLMQEFATLSGGEKMRVALSKLLLEEPDILLLDEPTNHLDIETTEWLENYLKTYKGSVLIISHDRYFLDRVITKIYELKSGQAEVYHGNFSDYLHEREIRYELKLKEYEGNQRKIKQLEAAAKNMRDWANRADNEKMYKRAKAMEKRIERMDKIDKPIKDENNIKLDFKKEQSAGKAILQCENARVEIAGKELATNINFKIVNGERIGLIGANGCGKTTFLKDILRHAKSDLYDQQGKQIRINPSVRIGYLEQDIKFDLSEEDIQNGLKDSNMLEEGTILDLLRYYHPMEEVKLRRILAGYEFKSEDVFKRVNTLSGGEKVRLKLCILILDKVNFLILDEPTNHIDIKTKEVLEEGLDNFDGTILFISHDRYFLNVLADRIFEMSEGGIEAYIGNYEYYKAEKEKRISKKLGNEGKNVKQEKLVKVNNPITDGSKARKKVNPWKVKEIEENIQSLEERIEDLNEELNLCGADYMKAEEVSAMLTTKENELEEVMEEYFKLI
jgi:ATPase subunit of ABC transporter with duplicated ATPase domains